MALISEMLKIAIRRYGDGDLPGAEQACLHVLRTEPWHGDALQILGVICGRLGRHEMAIAYLERALTIDSSNPDLRANLGVAFAGAGQFEEAVAHFQEALSRQPNHPVALGSLGLALASRGCFAEAIGPYRRWLQTKPGCATTHNNLGYALFMESRFQEAEEHFCEAVRLKPDYAAAYVNRAGMLLQMGRLADAISCCQECLRLDPNRMVASFYLAELAAQDLYQFTDDQIRHMESLTTAHDSGCAPDGCRLSNDDAAGFHFILAGLSDRAGEYGRAFDHYRRANDLKAQVFRQKNRAFDRERHRRLIDDIIATFDRKFFERVHSFGLATEVPVFVVGMPRTGSTLVEQILSSHPQVVAAGERQELSEILAGRAPYPAHMPRLEAGAALALAEEYVSRLSRLGPEAARIIDKMPDNYLHLGSICALFPRARIIHCRRDVMDVCLSCYFQYFSHINYTTSLEDLAFYYRQYERLMSHWRDVLPMPVYDVEYEQLVRDQEGISRGLIAFCGLEWSDRCTAFYENRRAVQTASKLQVRRPVYASSIARWKHYESHLLILQQALASNSVDAAAGTAGYGQESAAG